MGKIVICLTILVLALVTCSFADKSKECDTSNDCARDECCVQADRKQTKKSGRCKSNGSIASSCHVKTNDPGIRYNRNLLFDACPCANGLICRGSGVRERNGEVGICGKPQ